MFKLIENPRFTREVTVLTPVHGGHLKESFRATFRALRVSESQSFELATGEGTRSFLEHVLVTVDDVFDEAGAELPYSDQLRDRLLDVLFVRQALLKSYFDGVTPERLGN